MVFYASQTRAFTSEGEEMHLGRIAAERMVGDVQESGRHRLREASNVFRYEGEFWTVRYAGQVCRLKDSKGLRYLAVLLAQPGVGVAAIDLVVGGGMQRPRPAHAANRLLGHNPELARTSATRVLKAAIERIVAHHPSLGAHLLTTV